MTPQESGWTKWIDENQPDNQRFYFVACSIGVAIAIYEENKGFLHPNGWTPRENVTHFIEVVYPEPPKED